jgi:ribosomal protein S18 acetylase RimI-like enzyme
VTRDIELASLRAWPALEEEVLGTWTLRFSRGFTGRANSVQPFAGDEGRVPLAERVAVCERWYAERGRPCVFRITPFSETGLDAYLAERGYVSYDPTDVLRLDALQGLGGFPNDVAGEISEIELSEWLEAFARLSGLAAPHPVMGEIVSRIGPPSFLGCVGPEKAPIACGLAVADGPFLGLFDLVVDPRLRRRGHGTALVVGLCAWGWTRGATHTYLQVTRGNAAAAALYRRLGFRLAYEYSYRVPPDTLDERRA